MNIIIYLVVAAVIGWIASVIMKDRASIFINIIVAIIGAFLAGWFISPLLNIGTINDAITFPTMLVTLLGAVILIGIVHLFRRRI
ncbi:MAG: GlsB/YeaQ/YmgE family stress response membrane protein [Anaerolineaceae bacterium]|nr:GlsB/YeaQ/YmgE family stress response membrane protein [Anaerolineaceae bacterium]